MSSPPQNLFIQSPQFQILVDEDQQENQPVSIEAELALQLSPKKGYRSLTVSMIQDDDMMSEYFLADHIEEDIKQANQGQCNGFQKAIDNHQRNQLPFSFLIQQKHKPTSQQRQQQQQRQSRIPLHKRGFHYESIKPVKQPSQQQIIPNQVISPSPTHEQKHTSRLQIEKQKYNLSFDEVYGEIFIYIAECELMGYKKKEQGYFLLTNYRALFFKFIPELLQTKKRVDLPFGFVKTVQYQQKRREVVFQLHYEHYWKFQFDSKEDFDKVRIMLQVYSKAKDLKSSFAFSYALKTPEFQKSTFEILKEYVRMHLSDVSLVFPNEGFRLSDTYPPYICLPQQLSEGSREVIKSICQNFKGNRLPILTFRYGAQQWVGLWLSGGFVDDRKLNQKQLKSYFLYIRGDKRRVLHVYDCNSRSSKGFVESSLDSKIENHWLNLCSNSQVKTSYNAIVQAYITPVKSFYADIISSKWYDMVLHILKCSFEINEKIFGKQPVLVKEDETRQKSLMITALVQVILEPFYRTFKGFKYLVMKEFICFGFKFSSRLGNREPSDQCPTFILFLDAVAQLVHLNPLHFQYNSKYLGKLSNLMYTNIFGTFLADSPKQFFMSPILEQTVQIWPTLQNDLTKNAFYEIKNSILTAKPHTLNDIKFWTEHFCYMTSQPKDCYKMHPLAESTMDYVPLECLKVKKQNCKLKSQVEKQRQQILRLKQLLELKINQNNSKP